MARILIPALPLALAIVLAACGSNASPADPAAAGAPAAVPVNVVTLRSQKAPLARELAGRTVPSLIAEVRPQITGLVRSRLFTEGGHVRAGQVLYAIDDSAYRSEQNSARAALARAEATAASARLAANRAAQLVAIDAVSRQDADNAQAAYRQAQADVRAAQAAIQGANVTIGFTRVTAPISGQIGRSSVTQGALVTAAQPQPLATIQQLDPMYIDVTQSSSELLALRREATNGRTQSASDIPVKLFLEDGSPYSHEGRLAFSEATVDPTTGSYTLRVVVPNPQGLLLPGMYVRAALTSSVRPDALLVPQRAVTRDPKGNASVMVVGAGRKAESRRITVSRTVGDAWLVDGGLNPGDQVIVEGMQKVVPGALLAPSEAAAKAVAASSPRSATR